VVIGSGINLLAPDGLEGAAGVGADVDATELLSAFLAAFADGYRPAASGFAADVIARWTRRSATLGRHVAAVDVAGYRLEGTAVGLDAHGGLILEQADGSHGTVTSDEVVHLR
jgi:BirA family biotin operon repressor/biotin-[acetyl-CoA-carboxylase] ligase